MAPLIYLRDGEDLVVVGSMGGTPKDPAWVHNLRAAPDTEAEVGRERRAVRARVADAGGARPAVAAAGRGATRRSPTTRRAPSARSRS